MLDLHVRFDAETVVYGAPVAGGEGGLERVGHFDGTAVLIAVLVVDGLYAATTGDEVFRHGDFHLAVVRHGHDVLHQAFAEGTVADDNGTVEVLEAAAYNLAGGGAAAIDKHRQGDIEVNCTLDSLLELSHGGLDAEVAGILFR